MDDARSERRFKPVEAAVDGPMFKVGDRVWCVDACASWGLLKVGKVYTVSSVIVDDPPFFEIKVDSEDHQWRQSRFERVNDDDADEMRRRIARLEGENAQLKQQIAAALRALGKE